MFIRQPSLAASDKVDVETNVKLAEYPLGIRIVTSFQMDLYCQEEIDLPIDKISCVCI